MKMAEKDQYRTVNIKGGIIQSENGTFNFEAKVNVETDATDAYHPKKVWETVHEFFPNCIRAPENRYDILEPIGEGAYASVFLARPKDRELSTEDERNSQVYAIKSIDIVGGYQGKNTDRNMKERLSICSNEIYHLQSLQNSPYIVQFYDVGLSQKRRPSPEVWIVTEYCETGDIGTLMDNCNYTYSVKQVSAVAACTILGLKTMHQNSIVHRDIKPYNIFVTKTGIAKIGDLGTAVKVGNSEVTGTLAYLPPELLYASRTVGKGRGKRQIQKLEPVIHYDKKRGVVVHAFRHDSVYHDTKVDIWALGITTMQLILGKTPFFYLNKTVDIIAKMRTMHAAYRLGKGARNSESGDFKFGRHYAYDGDSALADLFHLAWMSCKEKGLDTSFSNIYRKPMENLLGVENEEEDEKKANRNFLVRMYEICHEPLGVYFQEHKLKNAAFVDFLRICLMKNPAHRPSTEDLCTHPFLDVQVNELLALEKAKVVQPGHDNVYNPLRKAKSVIKSMFKANNFGPVRSYIPNPQSRHVTPRKNTLEQLEPLWDRKSSASNGIAASAKMATKTIDPLDPVEGFL